MPLNPYHFSMPQEIPMPRNTIMIGSIIDGDDAHLSLSGKLFSSWITKDLEFFVLADIGNQVVALADAHEFAVSPFDVYVKDSDLRIEAHDEMVFEAMAADDPMVELYARVGYTYSKSGGWSHKDGTVSAKISGVLAEHCEPAREYLGEILKTLSVLSEQHASQEIARRNNHGADGPMSEIVVGDADGVSGE
jgi:hypothetical protein